MSNVGKPDDYNEYITSSSVTVVDRPVGGFMEERVCKVEYDSKTIVNTIEANEHYTCRACNTTHVIARNGSVSLSPICDGCLSAIGKVSEGLNKIKFLE